MTECNHEWIRLTSVELEERLLPKGYGADSISGCKLCGALRDNAEVIFIPPSKPEQSFAGDYWTALYNFSERNDDAQEM